MDTTIKTKNFGTLRIGEKFINPMTQEVTYPLRDDTHTVMFVTDHALAKMLKYTKREVPTFIKELPEDA